MSASTGQQMLDVFSAAFSDGSTADSALVQNMLAVRYQWTQPADAVVPNANGNGVGTAAANVTHIVVLDPATPCRQKVTEYKVCAAGAITAANTDFATFSLVYNNANGGADTVIATASTENKVGSLGAATANIPVSVTVTAANAVIPAGSQVMVIVTKAGAGKALPQLTHSARVVPV